MASIQKATDRTDLTYKLFFLLFIASFILVACSEKNRDELPKDSTISCDGTVSSEKALSILTKQTGDSLFEGFVSVAQTCKLESKELAEYEKLLGKYSESTSIEQLLKLYTEFDNKGLDAQRYMLLENSKLLNTSEAPNLIEHNTEIKELRKLGTTPNKAQLTQKESAAVKLLSGTDETNDSKWIIPTPAGQKLLLQITSEEGHNSGTAIATLDNISDQEYIQNATKNASISRGDENSILVSGWGSNRFGTYFPITSNGYLSGLVTIFNSYNNSDGSCNIARNEYFTIENHRFQKKLSWTSPCLPENSDTHTLTKLFEKKLTLMKTWKNLQYLFNIINLDRLDRADLLLLHQLTTNTPTGRSHIIELLRSYAKKHELFTPPKLESLLQWTKEAKNLINISKIATEKNSTDNQIEIWAELDADLNSITKDEKIIQQAKTELDHLAELGDYRIFSGIITQQLDGATRYNEKVYIFTYELQFHDRDIALAVANYPVFQRQGYASFYGKRVAKDMLKLKEQFGSFTKTVDVIEVANNEEVQTITNKGRNQAILNRATASASQLPVTLNNALNKLENKFVFSAH